MRQLIRSLSALAALALLVAGCADSPSASPSPSVTGTINVFAAASLQESFSQLGKTFQEAHPGAKVIFNFGPSSGLAEQIGQGAPADVFASASTKTMDDVVSGGDAKGPTAFATNRMEIAVPPDNPAGVRSVADLGRKDVKVALCQKDVPCGDTALKVFANAKLKVTPVTQEIDVKSTLSKVTLGEVDAGVVYVTDVKAAGSAVKGIPIPDDVNATTTYPIAPLTGSKNAATARAFVDYVLSPTGTAALTAAGFSQP